MTHDEIRKRLEKLLSQVDSPEPWTSRQQMLDLIGEAFGAVKTIPGLLDEIKSLIVSRTDVLRENEALIEEVKSDSERIAALTAERDAWQALAGDREARLQQAVRDTTTMTKAAHDRKKERDALAAGAGGDVPLRRADTLGGQPGCACDAGEPVPQVVLDPFAGSGTTLLVADRLGRDAIGVELNPTYAEMIERRLRGDAGMFADVEVAS